MLGELKKRMERCRKFHDVTRNGVVFDWELVSIDGAGFELFREPHHSDADIELAKSQIRGDRDVVRLFVTEVSAEELAAPIPVDPVRTRPIAESETRDFHTILHSHIADQTIYFQGKVWKAEQGAFRTLEASDVGRRLFFGDSSGLQIESDEEFAGRTAGFTEFPRGGDVVQLKAPWKWAGSRVKVGAYGFIDGSVTDEYLIDVRIIFNAYPFINDSFCSSCGGPGAIQTPISDLKTTTERIAMSCWQWRDGRADAHNGRQYKRMCRVWEWFPGKDA